jgi:hypothetical protein
VANSKLALISAARAVTLKLANQREAADPHAPVLIRAAEPLDLASALPIADPALDLAEPLKGPFLAEHLDWADEAAAAMELARIAGILPAFLVAPDRRRSRRNRAPPTSLPCLDPAAITIATRARLPVAACEDGEVVVFRSPDDTREHVALILGKQSSERVPLVRLHSECLTGDILGSLRCDCGPQWAARSRQWPRKRPRRLGRAALPAAGGAAASGSSTSSAPTGCRTRVSTRSRPTAGLASPPKRVISRSRHGCSNCSASARYV